MNTEKGGTKPDVVEHRGDETHLLKEIYRTQQTMIAVFSRIFGISASRLALLRLLAIGVPKEVGIMEISRKLGINAAAVTRLVREMEDKGWVRRRTDDTDGRRNFVRLTARGKSQFRKIHERMHEFERSLSNKVDEQDVQTVIRVLADVRGMLDFYR